MEIAFRVDASNRIGTGHVVRCLTLAEQLRAQGAGCRFITRAHPGHMAEAIRSRGFPVTELPAPSMPADGIPDGDYAQWLGVATETDAAETIEALAEQRPDWLVVDHYALDTQWESQLRPHVDRILAIDDLANRDHDCDALLDQNYSQDAEARYRDRLPPHTTRLLGPAYALLRPEYAQYRNALEPHSGHLDRVFIFFGGTDPDNLTGRALEALSELAFRGVAVDAVVGANNPHREALAAQAEARSGITLYPPQPHLAGLMATADLAIGAGGTTTWERCCLGLPSLVISIADNQKPTCEALAQDGIIEWLGHWDRVTADEIRTSLRALGQQPERLQALGACSSRTVDGTGTGRVVEHLLATDESK